MPYNNDKLRMSFNLPLDETSLERKLGDVVEEGVSLKNGYKYKIESITINVITETNDA